MRYIKNTKEEMIKKIIAARYPKFKYNKKLKKFVKNWSVIDHIVKTANSSEYGLMSKRLETFTHWPLDYFLNPKDLTEAGFFYTGVSDNIKCFSCGIVLNNWQPFDDIYEQHIIFSPKCKYLIFKKGIDFVKNYAKKLEMNYDAYKCSVCLDRMKNILFIPCLHISTCKQCARQLVNCPICRSLIREEKTIYLT